MIDLAAELKSLGVQSLVISTRSSRRITVLEPELHGEKSIAAPIH